MKTVLLKRRLLIIALAVLCAPSIYAQSPQVKLWCVNQQWLGHPEADGSITYTFVGAWSDRQKQRFVVRCDSYIRSVANKFLGAGIASTVAVSSSDFKYEDVPLCIAENDKLRFHSQGSTWQVNYHPATSSASSCGLEYIGPSQWNSVIGGAKGARKTKKY